MPYYPHVGTVGKYEVNAEKLRQWYGQGYPEIHLGGKLALTIKWNLSAEYSLIFPT